MKQKITLKLLGGLVALMAMFIFVPNFAPVQAQGVTGCPTGSPDCAQKGLTDIGEAFPGGVKDANYSIKDIARKVIEWALYLAAIIAVVFIIIGGFMYITSAGNDGQAKKGRDTLVNALIGLAIIILSYLIVQVVYNFLIQR